MSTYKGKFDLWTPVVLVHDPAKEVRMVTQIAVGGSGIRYMVCCGTQEYWCYENELQAPDGEKPADGFKLQA